MWGSSISPINHVWAQCLHNLIERWGRSQHLAVWNGWVDQPDWGKWRKTLWDEAKDRGFDQIVWSAKVHFQTVISNMGIVHELFLLCTPTCDAERLTCNCLRCSCDGFLCPFEIMQIVAV
jgi:hypothetical protein